MRSRSQVVLNTASDPGLHSWAELATSKRALEPEVELEVEPDVEPLALEDWQGEEKGKRGENKRLESHLVGLMASNARMALSCKARAWRAWGKAVPHAAILLSHVLSVLASSTQRSVGLKTNRR